MQKGKKNEKGQKKERGGLFQREERARGRGRMDGGEVG